MEFFRIIGVLQIMFWVVMMLMVIYLIFKRIEDKKRENFEDRDN